MTDDERTELNQLIQRMSKKRPGALLRTPMTILAFFSGMVGLVLILIDDTGGVGRLTIAGIVLLCVCVAAIGLCFLPDKYPTEQVERISFLTFESLFGADSVSYSSFKTDCLTDRKLALYTVNKVTGPAKVPIISMGQSRMTLLNVAEGTAEVKKSDDSAVNKLLGAQGTIATGVALVRMRPAFPRPFIGLTALIETPVDLPHIECRELMDSINEPADPSDLQQIESFNNIEIFIADERDREKAETLAKITDHLAGIYPNGVAISCRDHSVLIEIYGAKNMADYPTVRNLAPGRICARMLERDEPFARTLAALREVLGI